MADACVRQAWLTLGPNSVDLHDEDAGYFVTELDLGYPEVRSVTNNRPDAHGIDDTTQYFGGRTVSANVSAIRGAGAQIDAVATMFAPYMIPNVRPVLHYILDRPGAAERIITVRPAAYTYKIDDNDQRDVLLQFVASDPIAYDPTTQTVIAWAGSAGNVAGRRYDLTYDRVYPSGSASPTPAALYTPGDVTAIPKVRMYGPATGPSILFTQTTPGDCGIVGFLSSFVLGAAQYVDIDCGEKTAWLNGDVTKSVVASLNWNALMQYGWPRIPARTPVQASYSGSSTTSATQAAISWNDGYLS